MHDLKLFSKHLIDQYFYMSPSPLPHHISEDLTKTDCAVSQQQFLVHPSIIFST